MLKNVAGQKVGSQMVSATDGSAFTGTATVYVTGDAGTQALGSVSSGVCAHEGNGYHTYSPSQAETNYDLAAFTFTGTGAVPATVQAYTRGYNSGPLLWRSTVSTVNSQTDLELSSIPNGISWLGCTIVIRDASVANAAMTGVVTGVATGAVQFTAHGNAPFTIATGDSVEILAPWFTASDRSAITNTQTDVATLITKLTTGVTSLPNWLRAIARKTNIDPTTTTEINSTTGSGTGAYDATTDSLEAVRDRGDSAWTTGTGWATVQSLFEADPHDYDSGTDSFAAMLTGAPTLDELYENSQLETDIGNIVIEGGATVSAFLVDEDRMWRFESYDQLTAVNVIKEIVGFDGRLGMDFSRFVLPQGASLQSVTLVSITGDSGTGSGVDVDEPISVSADKLEAHLNVTAYSAGTYIVVLSATTTDSQTYIRRGKIQIQAA